MRSLLTGSDVAAVVVVSAPLQWSHYVRSCCWGALSCMCVSSALEGTESTHVWGAHWCTLGCNGRRLQSASALVSRIRCLRLLPWLLQAKQCYVGNAGVFLHNWVHDAERCCGSVLLSCYRTRVV